MNNEERIAENRRLLARLEVYEEPDQEPDHKLTTVYRIARGLMNLHGLRDWQFRFDSSKTRFGLCSYRQRTISLSRSLVLLNNISVITNTILHEIAHALVGRHHHHNHVWRTKAIAIGCDGSRCYSEDDVTVPKKTFTGTCPYCDKTYNRHKRGRVACSVCCRRHNGGRFDARFLLTWSRN